MRIRAQIDPFQYQLPPRKQLSDKKGESEQCSYNQPLLEQTVESAPQSFTRPFKSETAGKKYSRTHPESRWNGHRLPVFSFADNVGARYCHKHHRDGSHGQPHPQAIFIRGRPGVAVVIPAIASAIVAE